MNVPPLQWMSVAFFCALHCPDQVLHSTQHRDNQGGLMAISESQWCCDDSPFSRSTGNGTIHGVPYAQSAAENFV